MCLTRVGGGGGITGDAEMEIWTDVLRRSSVERRGSRCTGILFLLRAMGAIETLAQLAGSACATSLHAPAAIPLLALHAIPTAARYRAYLRRVPNIWRHAAGNHTVGRPNARALLPATHSGLLYPPLYSDASYLLSSHRRAICRIPLTHTPLPLHTPHAPGTADLPLYPALRYRRVALPYHLRNYNARFFSVLARCLPLCYLLRFGHHMLYRAWCWVTGLRAH